MAKPVNSIYSLWNDNIQSFKQKNNEASTPVFDSDWTSVSVPQTSEFTRIGRQFQAFSANRYTAGINSNATQKASQTQSDSNTDQVYTDRQLARVSVLTFDVTSAVYASACGKCLASVWQVS